MSNFKACSVCGQSWDDRGAWGASAQEIHAEFGNFPPKRWNDTLKDCKHCGAKQVCGDCVHERDCCEKVAEDRLVQVPQSAEEIAALTRSTS